MVKINKFYVTSIYIAFIMCQSLSRPSALYIYSDSCNLHDGHRHAIFMIEEHF